MTGPKVIDSFSGDYSFLSNFYRSTIIFEGMTYPSVEHAFQANKTLDLLRRNQIRNARSCGEAKRLGRSVILREDWEQIKIGLMEKLLKEKFANPNLKELLLKTGDANLIEGNDWGDNFWGVCRGIGHNHLGKLLMKARDELREENNERSPKNR